MENYKNEEVSQAEAPEKFVGDHWLLENGKEESLTVKNALISRLREAGWTDGEIGDFGDSVTGVLESAGKVSMELNIMPDEVEVVITKQGKDFFDADKDIHATQSIAMRANMVNFNEDQIMIKKDRKEIGDTII